MAAAVAILLAYLAWHFVSGRYGVWSYVQLAREEAQLDDELAVLKRTNAGLSRTVHLLRADRLDPDLLDQRARELLHLAHPDDVIIKLPSGK